MLDPLAHLARSQQASMLRMGLSPISDAQWLAPFTSLQYQSFMAHKHARIQEPKNPILADQVALPALLELQDSLSTYLQSNHQTELAENDIKLSAYEPVSESTGAVDCLSNMSFWLPDDICILQSAGELGKAPKDDYILTAASVLSPSHWRPEQKFLKPLSQIHEAIPGFSSELTPKITRFFNHLKPAKPVVRFNWGIQPGKDLNWQSESEPRLDSTPSLYYRSERQTLLRLPNTGAVVFFIRIDCCTLDELDDYYQTSNAKTLLLEYVAALPEAEREYKGLARFGL